MGGRGGGARTVLESPGASRDDERIVDLTRQLMPISEGWVSLARLRDNLEGMSRERQDAKAPAGGLDKPDTRTGASYGPCA